MNRKNKLRLRVYCQAPAIYVYGKLLLILICSEDPTTRSVCRHLKEEHLVEEKPG